MSRARRHSAAGSGALLCLVVAVVSGCGLVDGLVVSEWSEGVAGIMRRYGTKQSDENTYVL